MRGYDIQQLAGEDGVDRLAVAVGEAFQGQDFEAGMRTSRSARRRSSGMASARSAPRASSIDSCDQKSMPKEASSPHDSLRP